MSDTLIQRLRGYGTLVAETDEQARRRRTADAREAADRIESLEVQVRQADERGDDALLRAHAAEAQVALLKVDAGRWGVVLACVRAGTHGQWVVLEDDPHNDQSIKAQFVAAIDSAISAEQKGA